MNMPMKMQLDRRTRGGRGMATWQWSDFKLEGGADAQISTHRSKQKTGWVTDAKFYDYGLFSELTWTATSQSQLISGARYDRATADNHSPKGQPRRQSALPAGFIRLEHRLPALPLMVYAGVGYTERFPDYWELFSPTYGANDHSSAFDSVKTEKTTQLDIGAMFSGKQVEGWISAYVGQVNDFILFSYDPKNLRVSQAENVNAAIAGGEVGARYSFTENLSTEVSVAYAWGENRSTHRALPQMPPLDARLGLVWQQGAWSTSGLLRMVSPQHRISVNQGNVVGKDFRSSTGFAIFSINGAYEFDRQIKFSAGIDNIFNRTYSEHLNLAGNSSFGYSSNTPINEPGRVGWLKLNVEF